MPRRALLPALAFLAAAVAVCAADEPPIQGALGDSGLVGTWIYDDLPAAFAQAQKTGRPLLAVFR